MIGRDAPVTHAQGWCHDAARSKDAECQCAHASCTRPTGISFMAVWWAAARGKASAAYPGVRLVKHRHAVRVWGANASGGTHPRHPPPSHQGGKLRHGLFAPLCSLKCGSPQWLYQKVKDEEGHCWHKGTDGPTGGLAVPSEERAQLRPQVFKRSSDEHQPAEALAQLAERHAPLPRLKLQPLDGPSGLGF